MSNSSLPQRQSLSSSSGSGQAVENTQIAPEILPHEIEIFEEIGAGCFGKVYRGKCRGKEVAIKKLLSQSLDEKTLADFRKEIEIMVHLSHPNVVLFMGACYEPGEMCMVSEIMKGNLETLLHDPAKAAGVSISRRINFARDTAYGMAWLHGSNPQIIHRDLKPANLLIDANWRVKLCDFGLAAVKEHGKKIRDKGSIPGTPIWMAPEVLMGRPLDEKTDVYSYGIVLWEILTGNEPFKDITSFKIFKRAICLDNLRPPIPETTPEPLKNLLESTWGKDPNTRPTFNEIITSLDKALIDVLISDTCGREFWTENFTGGQETVTFTKFAKAFYKFIEEECDRDSLEYQCLEAILSIESSNVGDGDTVVTLETFGNVLTWFGPLQVNSNTNSILTKIRALMSKDYFHGDIPKDKAEKLLADKKKGTFLIRCSVTDPTCPFTISKVSRHGKINHQRITYIRDEEKFQISILYAKGMKNVESKPGKSLDSFISTISKDLYLKTQCPGSRYTSIFLVEENEPRLEGYLQVPSEF